MLRLIAFFILLISLISVQASDSPVTGPEPLTQEIEDLMASFKLDAAQAKVDRLAAIGYPGYAAYYRGNLLVYRHLGRMDAGSFRLFQNEFEGLLTKLGNISSQDPHKEVMLGELHCKRALLEFLHHNYLSAAQHARLGRQHINQNAQRFPNDPSQLKMLGLFNVVLGAVPSRYQWLTNMLGFSGDFKAGIEQLKKAAKEGRLLAMESEVILYHVDKSILNQSDQAIARLKTARAQRGPNLVLDYMLATGLMNIKQNEEALRILYRRDLYSNSDVYFIPFWDYQLGKAYYYKGDMTRARRYLARFIRDYHGAMFRTDAHFRMGMALTLSGHYDLGKPFFQAVAEGSSDQFEEDSYARHMAGLFAQNPPSETVQKLFRTRNYYDGGYFDQAMTTLRSMDFGTLNTDDKAEWHYRYGRILHSQGKLSDAMGHYQECLALQVSEDHRYMHAYSAFFQADIARAKNDLVKARQYYRQALSYNDYFYQDGLENRCKAALASL